MVGAAHANVLEHVVVAQLARQLDRQHVADEFGEGSAGMRMRTVENSYAKKRKRKKEKIVKF